MSFRDNIKDTKGDIDVMSKNIDDMREDINELKSCIKGVISDINNIIHRIHLHDIPREYTIRVYRGDSSEWIKITNAETIGDLKMKLFHYYASPNTRDVLVRMDGSEFVDDDATLYDEGFYSGYEVGVRTDYHI